MEDRYSFRGKRVGKREWAHGYFMMSEPSQFTKKTRPVIVDSQSGIAEYVDPATIGQCTEIPDKNKVFAFTGDIVKTKFFGKDSGKGQNFADYDFFVVTFRNGGHCLENKTRRFSIGYMAENPEAFEIIGKIHDNPELMKEV